MSINRTAALEEAQASLRIEGLEFSARNRATLALWGTGKLPLADARHILHAAARLYGPGARPQAPSKRVAAKSLHRALPNLFDIKDRPGLDIVEGDISGLEIAALLASDCEQKSSGGSGPEHVLGIHKAIFGSIYPFAGLIRTSELRKGRTTFASPTQIGEELTRGCLALETWTNSALADRLSFIEAAVVSLRHLNHAHPFLEGNGRTQRVYLMSYAEKSGVPMSFVGITGERMVAAAISSAQGDSGPMRELLTDACEPLRSRSLALAYRAISAQLKDIDDRMLLVAVPGRRYAGTYVADAGEDFLFFTQAGHIVVGNLAHLEVRPSTGDGFDYIAGAHP